ncbi:MAG: hypothetical protein K6G88_03435 [Lachnospiraceae bacterium]|nr:hypothetical protein [Lachnospiraceae bacterium]
MDKADIINRMPVINKFVLIIRAIAVVATAVYIIGSHDFWCNRYQKLANMHDDSTQFEEMGRLVIIFGSISLILFVRKRYFWGSIFAALTIWAICFLFAGFSCHACGAG